MKYIIPVRGTPQTPHIAMGHKLQTITSDWDSTATWNNRKTNTPWNTSGGGGDVSTAANLTSASTTVQAYNAWYSWNAPLAAVQGWVSGSLPNYGFMLSTDNAGNIGNAYAWASTEASATSQFPADSTTWPTLDVTWTGGADVTPPTAPTDPSLEPIDLEDSSAVFSFVSGLDNDGPNGVPASGNVVSEMRFRRGTGSFSTWTTVPGDYALVPDVKVGDALGFEVRSKDGAGNVSATTTFSTTAQPPAVDGGDDISAVGWFAAKFGVSTATATAWVSLQGTVDQSQSAFASDATLGPYYGGMWFDNDQRRVHVGLTSSSTGAIARAHQLATDWGFDSSLSIDQRSATKAQLDAAQSAAATSLDDLIEAHKVDVTDDVETGTLTFSASPNLSTTEAGRVATARNQSAVPTALDTAETSDVLPPQASCADRHHIGYAYRSGSLYLGCGGPLRAGTGQWHSKGDGSLVSVLGGDVCSMAFLAQTPKGTPLVMTAGHCVTGYLPGDTKSDYRIGSLRQTGGAGGDLFSVPIGSLHDAQNNAHMDGAVYTVTNPTFAQNPRPWVLVLKSQLDLVHSTTYDPHYDVRGTATAVKNDVVCATLAHSGATDCGTVFKVDPSHDRTWVAGLKAIGGDSGSPVYKDHNAYGVLTNGGPQKVNNQTVDVMMFYNVEAMEQKWDFEVLTVSNAHASRYYLHDCASGEMWIENQGCLLIL